MSPADQREQIERWARLGGVLVSHVFEELDESGGRTDRPLLDQAIARVEGGETQGIAVAYLSRFGRSLVDGLSAIQRITDAGGTFVSVQEGMDFSTDIGRHILRTMLSWAEWELDRSRAIWRSANRRAIARGAATSARPFGYRRRSDGRLTVDPVEGPLVVELFRRRADGASVRALCRYLEGTGVKTSRGNAIWREGTVRRMLRSRTYRGELHYAEFSNRNAHEPLVDGTTWRLAQQDGLRLPRPRGRSTPLLRGILRCAGCQRLMGATITMSGSSYESRVYKCRPIQAAGRCPAPASVVDSLVEPYVEALFWQELAVAGRAASGKRIADLSAKVERRERELDAYRDNPRVASTIGPDRFANGLQVRLSRVEQAQLELSRARARSRAQLPAAPELRERWPTLSLPERSALIAEVLEGAFLARGHRRSRIEDRLTVYRRGCGPVELPPFNPQSPFATRPLDATRYKTPALLHRRAADWDERRLRDSLTSFLGEHERWPGFTAFQNAGRVELFEQVQRWGGPRHWATELGLAFSAPKARTARGWSEQRVRQELGEYLDGRAVWPREADFIADGRGRLRRAVSWHGGAEHWAAEFDLALPARQRGKERWPDMRIKAELARFTRGRTDWPTDSEFQAAGLTGLCEAIKRRKCRDKLAADLGLQIPPGRNAGPRRWTDQAIEEVLRQLIAGGDSWPPERDFGKAGLWGLLRAIDNTSSREAWARRLGVKPPRRVSPPTPGTLAFA